MTAATRRVLAMLLALFEVVTLTALVAQPAEATSFPPSEWVIGARRRVVYLTFDGQTGKGKVEKLLDDLDGANANASFFVAGRWLKQHWSVGTRMVRDGHVVGNRGFGTGAFTTMSDEQIRASIAHSQQVVNRQGGAPRPFLRVPRGKRDLRVLRVAGSMGYRSVRCTFRAGGGSPSQVARRVVRRARPGAIISLDLWRDGNRRAVPDIVDGLRDRGFSVRTIAGLRRAHAIRWDVTLRTGSGGPEVAYLQRALRAGSYPAGRADGSFGEETLQAVYAFEKFHGLARDGVVPPSQMTAIATSPRPSPPNRRGKHFIDVDISRQILREVRNRRVRRTLPISSGNEEYYTQDGERYKAHTPRGDFVTERKIPGWRTSRLGRLWYPSYFIGGFAIHGSESVPPYPASHGCIRLPMHVTKGFYRRTPIGRRVFVHN